MNTATLNSLIEQIKNLSESDLIQLNNQYCWSSGIDSEVFYNDEDFFNTYFEGKPYEAARAIHFGNWNFAHDYVQFNGYGNLESFYAFDLDDVCELPEVIAEYAYENQDEFSMLDFEDVEDEETED